jgi:hypothetical protein
MTNFVNKLKKLSKNEDLMCKVFYIMTGLVVLNRLFSFIIMIFFADYSTIGTKTRESNVIFALFSLLTKSPVKQFQMWSAFEYTLAIMLPLAGFAFFCSSSYAKNRTKKIKAFSITMFLVSLLACFMIAEWSNALICYILSFAGPEKIQLAWQLGADKMLSAIRAGTIYFPLLGILLTSGMVALTISGPDTEDQLVNLKILDFTPNAMPVGKYTCEVTVCRDASSGAWITIPENRRMEATLIQGATGTGKTSMLLLPMCASDLEKKFFFQEELKRLAVEALDKGYAYIDAPFSSSELNERFSMEYIKPKKGKEEEFNKVFSDMTKYVGVDNQDICYKNLGITVVEPDGKFCSDFIGVAKNYGMKVKTIDPDDPDTYGMNPFQNKNPDKVASIIATVLHGMYESENPGQSNVFFGQVTQQALENIAILLKVMYPRLNDGAMPTLEDMLKMMYDYSMAEKMCEEMKKIPELAQEYRILIKYFEKNFYTPPYDLNGRPIPGTYGSGRKDTEKFLYGATTQLDNLMRNEKVKNILCSRDKNLDFDKVLANGECVAVCTRRGELGALLSRPFGMFFILSMQDAVLRRPGNEKTRIPHFLYIDEFPDFVNKETETCFTLFRKYRCGMIVAIQNLSQLARTKNMAYYRQVVVSNSRTHLVYGNTNVEDSEYWSKVFGRREYLNLTNSLSTTPLSQIKEGSDGISSEKISASVSYTDNIKPHSVNELAFKVLYYNTRDAKGNRRRGKGKTDFLDARHKKEHKGKDYDFSNYLSYRRTSLNEGYWSDSIAEQEDRENRILGGDIG